jgi:hypothetical protein
MLAAVRAYYAEPARLSDDVSLAAIDTEIFLETVRRNAVTPLVHAALSLLRDRLPPGLWDELDARTTGNAVRNLRLTGELLELLDALSAAGIPALPYKGPVLALTRYGDLALREFVDLDLLVAREDALAAIDVLRARGYETWIPVSDMQLRFQLRSGHDHKLIRDDDSVVEVQWAIAERSFDVPRGTAGLFRRAGTALIGGREVPTLSQMDEALVLTIHGAMHLWERLAWICDEAEILRRLTDDQARELLRVATALRMRRLLLSGVGMVERMLRIQLPRPLVDAARADERLAPTLDALGSLSLAPGGPTHASGREHLRLRLALKDDPAQRLAEALRAVLTPTVSDWYAVRLPDRLWSLYYPVRLVRLARSYVAGDRSPGDWLRELEGQP